MCAAAGSGSPFPAAGDLSLWELPQKVKLGGKSWEFYGDFRNILLILSYFQNPNFPDFLRWQIALALFYKEPVPPQLQPEAMEYLALFINGGRADRGTGGQKLLDWQQDAPLILSGVNQAAGQEVRALPFCHWWTFLSYFHAIGEGPLATVVSIRKKLSQGKKLEPWERDYYRENPALVDLKKTYTRQEEQERKRLLRLLEGKGG